MTDGAWVLAIDVGTSSARAMAFDQAGQAVDGVRAQIAWEPRRDPPGASEFDVAPFIDAVALCIDGAMAAAGPRASRFRAVGLCTFWHSMAGLDTAGDPVTPVVTWADLRPAAAARVLRAHIDTDALHARTGCALHPSYYPARLAWLRDADPAAFARVAHWVSPGELLAREFLGEQRCPVSMASATGLMNQSACQWDHETCAAISLDPASLPPLVDLDEPAKGLRPQWASRWPALARIPWAPAIGDGAAGNLGSGCANSRRFAINLGTSGAIRAMRRTDSVEIPPDLWCYRLDSRRPIMGGAFSDGGDALVWLRGVLAMPDQDDIENAIASQPPDSHGLTFLPFLAGERSAGWRPDARATLHGLSLNTRPVDIARAVIEGIALRFALVAASLSRSFGRPEEIVASGGVFAAMPIWAAVIADAIGRPITLSSEPEASARGAALVALRTAGILEREEDAPAPLGPIVRHDPGRRAILKRALERQQRIYEALTGI